MNVEDTFFRFVDKSKYDSTKMDPILQNLSVEYSSCKPLTFFKRGTNKWCFEARIDGKHSNYIRIPWDSKDDIECHWCWRELCSMGSGRYAKNALYTLIKFVDTCPGAFQLELRKYGYKSLDIVYTGPEHSRK